MPLRKTMHTIGALHYSGVYLYLCLIRLTSWP